MDAIFVCSKTSLTTVLVESPERLLAIEIKAGKTVTPDYFKELRYWQGLPGNEARDAFVIYGGDQNQTWRQGTVRGWQNVVDAFDK